MIHALKKIIFPTKENLFQNTVNILHIKNLVKINLQFLRIKFSIKPSNNSKIYSTKINQTLVLYSTRLDEILVPSSSQLKL